MSLNRNNSNRLKAVVAEQKSKIIQLEAERQRLQDENDRLSATPARALEWQRQEVVATTGAVLEILEELTTKAGVVYGNVAAIRGIFANKGALNMSTQTQRELAIRNLEPGDTNRAA